METVEPVIPVATFDVVVAALTEETGTAERLREGGRGLG
jgi:hypothetical protein